MHSTLSLRSLLLALGLAILLVATWFLVSDIRAKSINASSASQVLSLGNQFDSVISEVADPFEKLIDSTNNALRSLSQQSARYDLASSVLSWIAVAISAAITMIAAISGVDPKQTPEPQTPRRQVMKLIAILAAAGSCLLVINERIDKLSTQTKATSRELYEKATIARRALLNAGSDLIAAEAAKDGLYLALAERGYAPR